MIRFYEHASQTTVRTSSSSQLGPFWNEALSPRWKTTGAGYQGHMQAADGPNKAVQPPWFLHKPLQK